LFRARLSRAVGVAGTAVADGVLAGANGGGGVAATASP